MTKLSEHEQWMQDKGIGWTAEQFWEWLESNNIQGPYTETFRSQYIRNGMCHFPPETESDLQKAHELNAQWHTRHTTGL